MWPSVELKDAAPADPSKAKFGKNEVVWHLTLDQIESNSGEILHKNRRPSSEAGSSTYIFDTGNVLYSKLRPYLNKVLCPNERGIATTELIPLRPSKEILYQRYLMYYLRSNYFLRFAKVAVSGAKMPRIIMAKFWKHKIPLPPPSEQRRIVEMFDQADELRKMRNEANAKAERILPALFYKMFGDPMTNSPSDNFQNISESAKLIMGQSPPSDSYNNENNGLPFFQGKLDFGDLHPVPRKWCSSPSRVADEGDVLLCVRAPVGPTNIANQKCCIGRGLAAIRPLKGKTTTEFLIYSIRAQEKWISRKGQGSTFQAIRKQDVESIAVPKVEFSKQEKFSKIARSLQSLSVKQSNSCEHLEKLFSVMLHRAFTGDLTAKWREAHMKELLKEMEEQSKVLNIMIED